MPSFARLDGAVALVTGAGAGIGRACVIELARAGAHVVASSRTEENAAASVALAEGSAEAHGFAVTDAARREQLVELLRERHGRLDVLVANAGLDLAGEPSAEELTEDEWDAVLETNLASVFRLVRGLLPLLGRGAAIVTIGSANSLVARERAAAYVASKHGLLGLTKALAVDLAPRGIRANCVCPGTIDTPLTDAFLAESDDPAALRGEYEQGSPLGRMGTPAEVAACVRFLASSDASFVTGAALAVDGGWTAV